MRYAKILVVDDDPEVLDTLKLYLQDNMQVVTARSGRQAVDYMETNTVDLILLDVEMPIMNGIKTLEHIREHKEYDNIPVMFLTGHSN